MEQGKAAHPEGNTGVRGDDKGNEEFKRVSAAPTTPITPPELVLAPQRGETAVTRYPGAVIVVVVVALEPMEVTEAGM